LVYHNRMISLTSSDFNNIFWTGTIAFFILSIAIWIGRVGDVGYVFYAQVLAGFLMFAGSKIGREFLGFKA
jgi:hypothetical protein